MTGQTRGSVPPDVQIFGLGAQDCRFRRMAKRDDKAAARRAAREEAERLQAAARSRDRIKAFVYLGLIGLVILGLVFLVFVLPVLKKHARDNRIEGLDFSAIGTSPTAAGCRPLKKVKVVVPKEGWHVKPGTHLDYTDAPPAYGKHWSQYLDTSQYRTIFTSADRPPKEQLVHSLEHGHTVIWYDATLAADSAQLAALNAIAKKLVVDDGVVIVPWTSTGDKADGGVFPDGAHLAITHWTGEGTAGSGIWEYCNGVSGPAIKTFMVDYPKSDSPEPDAP
jgi:hypothetical protein